MLELVASGKEDVRLFDKNNLMPYNSYTAL